MYAFQSMKSVDNRFARCDNQNDLAGTVNDFSLSQSYPYLPPLLKKYKGYFCPLPTINILEDLWFDLILKDNQIEDVTLKDNFLQERNVC